MWYQLQIEHCLRDEVEGISEALEETGALSITLTDKNDDPVLEPEPGTTPLWPDVIINALYNTEQEASLAKSILSAQFKNLSFLINQLEDKDWERVWMDEFKPTRFGERLWICPSWVAPPDPQAVNLRLDPGLAFGTGTHPTTALCLHWLDQAALNNKIMIDYGCGSGILALAALKLGAEKVYAVDIDEQALEATKNNALNNAIDFKQLIIGLPTCLEEPADLIIANILLSPLLSLRDKFSELLREQGMLVIAGILDEQKEELIEAYQGYFQYQSSQSHDNWSLVFFRKAITHE